MPTGTTTIRYHNHQRPQNALCASAVVLSIVSSTDPASQLAVTSCSCDKLRYTHKLSEELSGVLSC